MAADRSSPTPRRAALPTAALLLLGLGATAAAAPPDDGAFPGVLSVPIPSKKVAGFFPADTPLRLMTPQELDALVKAHRRWPTGIYMFWYPVKDLEAVKAFRDGLAASGIKRLLRAELNVRVRTTPDRFNGSGLVICNPPWHFETALRALFAGLAPILADGPGGGVVIDEIAGE